MSQGSGTRRSVAANIRFQLDQLGAQNAHHEFEHLCRQFSRERIASNILPATGPVSTGGDQGRDFETFTSFLSHPENVNRGFFLGAAESKPLVFACSLTARPKVREKIKTDVRTICNAGIPHIIYFFSNQSIPVSWRHSLQGWALEQMKCRLEIIDAEALADHLAEPGLFWIAEEYLHVPAELFPMVGIQAGSAYEQARARWIESANEPFSFADFVEIKLGLRRATFKDSLKPDLSRWISKMETFNEHENEDLARRSTYEVCVATLRGQHNLTPRRHLIEKYFNTWAQDFEPSELRDAAILLSYASSALLHAEFDIEPYRLHEWSKALASKVDQALSHSTGPNTLADLLYTRSTIASLPFLKGIKPTYALEGVFKWWSKTVKAAERAPLFPIEEFADLLTKLAEFFSDSDEYHKIVEKVDLVLEKRSKGYLVAEKSRDRAVALMEANKTVAAINELHKAKVRWFTGDTLEGTILAMLALSQAYLNLGLIWAAKYHALGAAFVVAKSNDDAIRVRIAETLGQLGDCLYSGGEWIAFSDLVPLYFLAHYQHAKDPDDWDLHAQMQRMIFHFLVMRSIGKALGGTATFNAVEQLFREISIPEELREEILSPPFSLDTYETMEPAAIARKTSKELFGRPFSDCGIERTYSWRALGITWNATCANTLMTIPYVEEFVAVLQIAIVDLASIDLCLLPTSVTLNVVLADIEHIEFKHVPDNSKLSFAVTLPRNRLGDEKLTQRHQLEILSVTVGLLEACSCLPDRKFKAALEGALRHGLRSKVFLVRPYFELFLEFAHREDFDKRREVKIGGTEMSMFELRQAEDLSWRDGPGPGYSKAKSYEFISNRYRRALPPVRRTLARLKASPHFQAWITQIRSEGMLDWQILLLIANSVLNFRGRLHGFDRDPQKFQQFSKEVMESEEAIDAPEFPEQQLFNSGEMMRMTTLATNAQVWGLKVRIQTPDFKALKRLMDMRYGQAVDDIPHEDLFGLSKI